MTTRLPQELSELPIEPLPEHAWQRVERRVFEALKENPRTGLNTRSWLLLAASAASLLLLAAWLRGHLDTTAQYVTHARSQQVHAPGVELQIEPETSLSRAGAVWTLERGAAEFRVAPRKHDPLTVLAAEVRVEVVGTLFRVERHGERVRVETLEGKVRVVAADETQLVAAGDHWPRELANTPPQLPPDVGTAAESPTTAPASEHSTRATQPKRGDAPSTQRQRFEQAAALEAHAPDQALRIYRALSGESGPWASNALFALARLEVERRWPVPAERDLRRYIQRYPNGLNISDAHALLRKLQEQRALHVE